MFEKILVPLDGSDAAREILDFVIDFARPLHAEVHLITVVHPDGRLPAVAITPEFAMAMEEEALPAEWHGVNLPLLMSESSNGPACVEPASSDYDSVGGRSYSDLEAEARRLTGLGVASIAHIVEGSPGNEIVRAARNLGTDMIAMVTRRGSAWSRGVLGSVTDRVLHSSPIPVTVIGPRRLGVRQLGGPLREILVPLDGSYLSERAVEPALQIAGAHEVPIRFVLVVAYSIPPFEIEPIGIIEDQAEVRGYLEAFVDDARRRGLSADAEVLYGTAAGALVSKAGSVAGTMIVMGTRGYSGLSRWVIGSVTDKLVRSSQVPVLVIPPQVGAGESLPARQE
ncbi:MAG: universal stress protein [Dehalococcoidia bacterium]